MEPILSRGCAQGPVRASSGAFAFAVFILLLPVPRAGAAKLGGPYYVDDAEIGKVGSCEVESWNSSAGNGDRITVFSPACVFNFGSPVEVGTNLLNARSDGDGISTVSLTAKTVPIPIGPTGFGLALSGAVVYDPFRHAANGLIFTVPVTFDLTEKLRLNINVGAQYNAEPLCSTQPVAWAFPGTLWTNGASFPRRSRSSVPARPTRAFKAEFVTAPPKTWTGTSFTAAT